MLNEIQSALRAKKSTAQVNGLSEQAVAKIRRKNAEFALQAPDEKNRAVLQSNLTLLRAVQTDLGNLVCGNVALNGARALPDGRISDYFEIIDATGASVFMALASGRDQPVNRTSVTDDDYAQIADQLIADGLSEEQILIVARSDTSKPEYCDALLIFIDATQMFPGNAGERIRAAFVRDVAAG